MISTKEALENAIRNFPTGKSDLLTTHAPQSDHYKRMAIQPIQYIEANGLGFSEGNIIKYVSRWRRKNGIDDLRKAEFYIKRLIEQAEMEKGEPR